VRSLYKISKKIVKLSSKLHKVLLVSFGVLFVSFISYLLLPPIIQLHTALDNAPKLSHHPNPVKNLKTVTPKKIDNHQPSVVQQTAPAPKQVNVSSPTSTPSPTPSVTPKIVSQPAPSAISTLTPTSTSSTTSSTSPSSTSSTSPSSTSSTSPSSTSSTPPSSSSTSSSSSTPPPSVSYTSSNWSGYMSDNNSDYTNVTGQWVVPNPTGNGTSTTADASWIGIGGVKSNDLIQIGTVDNVTASGTVYSAAFYELLPDASVQITAFNISPGDSISASIDQTGTNLWTITITDNTTNQTYTKNLSYDSSLSSAEWIEEDPSNSNGQLMPFDNFGTITFTNAYTTDNGSNVDLSAINADSITMINSSGQDIAVPSSISSSGSSFSVQREN